MANDQTPEAEIVTVHGAVAVVTLPAPALNRAVKEQLLAALRRLATDDGVRAVVLTGSGRVFCAAQDLGEHAAALDADPAHAFDTLHDHYNPVILALTILPKPVVAAVNGTCAGAGISLALACDIRVCSAAARFAAAFTGIGLTFDSGLSATLAYAEAKRAIQAAARPSLPDVLAAEAAAQSRLGLTEDHRGAVRDFLAKQRPAFHGR